MALTFPFEVIHKTKGEGVAIQLEKIEDKTYIKIAFKNYFQSFAYPDEFVVYMKAKNLAVHRQIWEEHQKGNDGSERLQKNAAPFISWGDCMETKALDVYRRLSKIYQWDRTQCKAFAPMGLLYAKNVTPEGYGVYMIVHNNLWESYNEKYSWYTYMKGEIIEEVWFIDNRIPREDLTPRVIFARSANGYIFQGVYVFYNAEIKSVMGKARVVKTFRRISLTYPVREMVNVEPVVTRSPRIRNPKPPEITELACVEDKCKIKAYILESKKETTVMVDLEARPFQQELIGKKIGDEFTLPKVPLTYRIEGILKEKT